MDNMCCCKGGLYRESLVVLFVRHACFCLWLVYVWAHYDPTANLCSRRVVVELKRRTEHAVAIHTTRLVDGNSKRGYYRLFQNSTTFGNVISIDCERKEKPVRRFDCVDCAVNVFQAHIEREET